jgi:two-component system response regulator HydG
MSTRENLLRLVEQKRFAEDLYHRIGAICLTLPPLRHRQGDITLLAEAFRDRFSGLARKSVSGFTRGALTILTEYSWPGNVRELEATVRHAVDLCTDGRISSDDIAAILGPTAKAEPARVDRSHVPGQVRPLKEALEEPEKRIILQALQALEGNRQETALRLDINRTTLFKKMKKYGLLTHASSVAT